MRAVGQHLIVKIPPKKDRTDGGLVVTQVDQRQMHGLVQSMGVEALEKIGDVQGKYMVFDPSGAIPIEVDSTGKHLRVAALDYSMCLAVMTREEVIETGGTAFDE